MKAMIISRIRFVRTKGDNWEPGVIINEGDGPILDVDGKVVESVHDYHRSPSFNTQLVVED